ncbi:hypothetical protein CA13_06340 [Planctomycetes bacterium CA13]|uniref:Uncharacterized protein n=1 Tax=Novipirellula herctigrandis TaxID=2527986 RepID=A0A5C5YWR7_9BACT|nr:hypothetical protein CA13_06340 [Planctomycetes bacterium CA13]
MSTVRGGERQQSRFAIVEFSNGETGARFARYWQKPKISPSFAAFFELVVKASRNANWGVDVRQ